VARLQVKKAAQHVIDAAKSKIGRKLSEAASVPAPAPATSRSRGRIQLPPFPPLPASAPQPGPLGAAAEVRATLLFQVLYSCSRLFSSLIRYTSPGTPAPLERHLLCLSAP
jgi:hypothetical protein